MQLFAGILLPNEPRHVMAAQAEPAIRLQPDLVWIPAPWWHLTLVYFPSMTLQDLAAVSTAVAEVVSAIEPPLLTIGSPGAYPDPTAAHELFVEVESADEALLELRHQVAASVTELGGSPDPREFRQHIGLARSPTPADVSPAMELLAGHRGSTWTPESISLVALRPAIHIQPHYDLVAEHNFVR